MLNNCLIIDKDRWDVYQQYNNLKDLGFGMIMFDFVIIKDKTTFRFLKNRHDCLTNIPIPNEYLPAILAYYKSVTNPT